MSCEKASRRLRCLFGKARRLGLTEEEVAELSIVRKIVPSRSTSTTWFFLVAAIVLLGGCIVLAILCSPCINPRNSHQEIHTRI